MQIPNPRRAGLLAVAFAFLLTGCVQPIMLPITPTPAVPTRAVPTPEAATISAATPDVEALTDRLAAEYGMVEDPARNVAAKQIEAEAEQPLFVAYTYGPPPDDSSFMHKVSIHAAGPDGWSESGRVELECVNYMEESSLEQVAFEPSNVWLTVQGGAGAHGGCFELLRWDGQSLTVVISGFNSSPNAGSVADLDGDGQLDLVLNNSDQYIFCYACGMQLYGALIFRWDGQDLVEVSPAPLSGDQPAALRALNDHAVELAAAGLFADALAKFEEAEALAPEDPTVRWNAVWVRNYLEESRQLVSTSPFPLLNHAFAGDWEAAFDALWTIGLPALSGDAPIPSDSAAFGFEERVGNLLASYADTALALQPERAALHALGAWGRYLLNSDDPAVHRGFRRAAEVAGEDSRYNEIVTAFEGRIGTIPVAPTAAAPPSIQALTDQLAAEYGMADDPARHVAVQQIDAAEEASLFVAYTYGLPPDDDSFMHKVSIHAAGPGGWSELGRVELACVNYLDELSLEQVTIEQTAVWLTVQGGAGTHGGCLELLRWDGETLAVVISSFNSIPNAGSVRDLNGDGRVDLLLNNSDPYIFCYACGVQLYQARFFHWDGEELVEAAPRLLSDDHAADLRDMNDHAIYLAEAALFADALTLIEQTATLAPDDPTVHWNGAWIRHHLDVSRQLASASPFPLLNHVFAGDWDTAFDALWTIGLSTLSSDAPIPSDSAASGFDEVVGELLVQYADGALTMRPERAAIHALGAWGRYLLDRDDPAALAGFQRAAELAPSDSRYDEIVAAFADRSN